MKACRCDAFGSGNALISCIFLMLIKAGWSTFRPLIGLQICSKWRHCLNATSVRQLGDCRRRRDRLSYTSRRSIEFDTSVSCSSSIATFCARSGVSIRSPLLCSEDENGKKDNHVERNLHCSPFFFSQLYLLLVHYED